MIHVDRDRRLVQHQLMLAGDFRQHVGGVLDVVAVPACREVRSGPACKPC